MNGRITWLRYNNLAETRSAQFTKLYSYSAETYLLNIYIIFTVVDELGGRIVGPYVQVINVITIFFIGFFAQVLDREFLL